MSCDLWLIVESLLALTGILFDFCLPLFHETLKFISDYAAQNSLIVKLEDPSFPFFVSQAHFWQSHRAE